MGPSYTYVLTLGFLCASAWLYFLPGNRRSGRSRVLLLDHWLITFTAAVVGGRITYALTHFTYFQDNTIEILYMWNGGLDGLGALLSASLAMLLLSKIRRAPFWSIVDQLALPGLILDLSHWTGCMLDGCAYGRTIPSATFLPLTPDYAGDLAYRIPVQVSAIFCCLLAIRIAYSFTHQIPGQKALFAILALGFIHLLASFFRADPVISLRGVRLDTIESGLILLSGLILMTWRLFSLTRSQPKTG